MSARRSRLNPALRALADRRGMPVRRLGAFAPTWTGAEANEVLLWSSGDLAHEIGHHHVAPIERRRQPNYGLGNSVRDAMLAPVTQLVSERTAVQEEKLATLVGVLLVAHFVPEELTQALEQTGFVAIDRRRDRWYVTAGTGRLIERAMRRGVVGTCAVPQGSTPHTLAEWMAGASAELLAPLLGEVRP